MHHEKTEYFATNPLSQNSSARVLVGQYPVQNIIHRGLDLAGCAVPEYTYLIWLL